MLKIRIQDRVVQLWNEHHENLSGKMTTESILPLLEYYAEDEMYLTHNEIEIEQIERLIASEYDQEAEKEMMH